MNNGDMKRKRTAQGEARGKLGYLNKLAEMFPGFIGKVVSEYTLVSSLDAHLMARGIDPALITVGTMTTDLDQRNFTAIMTPKKDASFLQITHIGVSVAGARTGYLITIEEMCGHMSKAGQKVNLDQFKSITPVDDHGMVHLELAQPRVVTTPIPPDELIAALNNMCESADDELSPVTDLERDLDLARQALLARTRRLQSQGKSLIEVETATAESRTEIKELETELEAQRSTGNAVATLKQDQIVNPNAPLAGTQDLTADEVITIVTQFAANRVADCTGRIPAGISIQITIADLYGTAPGIKPGRALQHLSDRIGESGACIGTAAEHALISAGWYLVMLPDLGPVWTLPMAKGSDPEPDPVPGVNGYKAPAKDPAL